MPETVYVVASVADERQLRYVTVMLQAEGYRPVSSADFTDLREMVSALMGADCVVTVGEWGISPGADVEVTLAAALGKPVLGVEDLLSTAA